jgi:hypothetical protein
VLFKIAIFGKSPLFWAEHLFQGIHAQLTGLKIELFLVKRLLFTFRDKKLLIHAVGPCVSLQQHCVRGRAAWLLRRAHAFARL